MSVAFARAVVDGLKKHGITVHEHPGCWARGNGQTSAYEGMIVHHTATPFDKALPALIGGRSDLPGPLCNMAGHANGDVTLVAAHPANHAGASGGRSMGPLPRTRNFNKCVWGLEIMYPGTQPMTPQQRRTALIMAGVVCGILKRPNPEWARAHFETSVTGKWDPGYANGKSIDMAQFRRDIWGALQTGGPAPAPAPSPGPPGRTHIVARGESLSAIGRRYGVTWQAIAQANALADPNAIREGQTLRIPDAPPPAAAAPTPAPAPALAPVIIAPAPAPAVVAPGTTVKPIDPALAKILVDNGIVADPAEVVAAAEAGGLELAVLCPKLVRESYGGKNVFGNDKVAYPESGPYTADTVTVTLEAVLAYLAWRGPGPDAGTGGRQNGVGPSQLTWWSLQDEAIKRGGLHIPLVNMTVGAEAMARHVNAAGGNIRDAGARYNGGKPYDDPRTKEPAREYGRWLEEQVGRWRALLGGFNTQPRSAPQPVPPPVTPAPAAPAPSPSRLVLSDPGPPWNVLVPDMWDPAKPPMRADVALAWATAHAAFARGDAEATRALVEAMRAEIRTALDEVRTMLRDAANGSEPPR